MKIYLAGAQTESAFNTIVEIGYSNVLMSYLYIKNKTLEKYVEKAGYHINFMIDSGAFSFRQKPIETILRKDSQKYGPRDAVKKFLDDYVEWLEKNKTYIEVAVELDIGNCVLFNKDAELSKKFRVKDNLDPNIFVTKETVNDWRRDIFSKMNGIDICYVGHGESIKELIQYGDYIGQSGDSKGQKLSNLFTNAKKHNLRIHGFAVTGNIIRKYPFTSVDSTSWKYGARHGMTCFLKGGQMVILDSTKKVRRKRFKKVCEEIGVNFDEFIGDNLDAVNKFNCYQWKLYADYMDKRWNNKELSDVSKQNRLDKEKELNEKNNEIVIRDTKIHDVNDGIQSREFTVSQNNWVQPYSFLKCSECYVQNNCPKYEDSGNCFFKFKVDITKKENIKEVLEKIIEIQYGRILRGKIVEEVDGGVPDKILDDEIKLMLQILKDVKELTSKYQDELVIKAKGQSAVSKLFESLKDVEEMR